VRVLGSDRGPVRGDGGYSGELEEGVSTTFNGMNVGLDCPIMAFEEGVQDLLGSSRIYDLVENDSNMAAETVKDLLDAVVNVKYLEILVGICYDGGD
jgi:hypothetical protein